MSLSHFNNIPRYTSNEFFIDELMKHTQKYVISEDYYYIVRPF